MSILSDDGIKISGVLPNMVFSCIVVILHALVVSSPVFNKAGRTSQLRGNRECRVIEIVQLSIRWNTHDAVYVFYSIKRVRGNTHGFNGWVFF